MIALEICIYSRNTTGESKVPENQNNIVAVGKESFIEI